MRRFFSGLENFGLKTEFIPKIGISEDEMSRAVSEPTLEQQERGARRQYV